jgi:mRNA interferase MazF
VRQYEVWWATLPLPAGRRPVVLLSRNSVYPVRERVLIAEVTSKIRGVPFEVPVGSDEGLRGRSVINLDNLRIILKSRLEIGGRIGALNPAKARLVKRALGHALDWDELKLL